MTMAVFSGARGPGNYALYVAAATAAGNTPISYSLWDAGRSNIKGNFNTVQDILNSNLVTTSNVAVGDILGTRDGHALERAEDDASDYHFTGQDGLLFYEAGPNFSTRARLLEAITRERTWQAGTILTAAGLSYQKVPLVTANMIATMPGYVPVVPFMLQHFGDCPDNDSDPVDDVMEDALEFAGNVTPYSAPTESQMNGFNGAAIHVPSGQYAFDNGLPVPKPGVAIKGESRANTMFWVRHTGTFIDFSAVDEENDENLRHFEISGISFRGASRDRDTPIDPPASMVAIRLGLVRDVLVADNEFNGFYGDVLMEGCQASIMLRNNLHVSRSNVSGSTNEAGGYHYKITALEVNDASNATTGEDPDRPGVFYAHPSGINISGYHHQSQKDAKLYGIVIEASDGVEVDFGHFGNVNNCSVLLDAKASNVPMANIRFNGVFFDQKNSNARYVVHIPAPSYATADGERFSVEFNNCKFNEDGANRDKSVVRAILCENPYVDRLVINGGVMDKMQGAAWIDLKAGRGTCIIDGLEMEYADAYLAGNDQAMIHLDNATSAETMFENVMIKVKIWSPEALRPKANIRIDGYANNVNIGQCIYLECVDGDGLMQTVDMDSAAKLSGGGRQNGCSVLGQPTEGVYDVTISDETGNVSATTVEGYWIRQGPFVDIEITNFENIDTTGLEPTEELRFSLPSGIVSRDRRLGTVRLKNVGGVNGNGDMLHPVAGASATYMTLQRSGGTDDTKGQLVSNFTDDTTDVLDMSIRLRELRRPNHL